MGRGLGRKIRPPAPGFLFLLLGSAVLSGCTLIGSGGGGDPGREGEAEVVAGLPQGDFNGFLELEGGRVDGVLTLTPTGGSRLEGFFEAPPDLVAIGRGSLAGYELRLELSYEGPCPGTMDLRGRWEEAAGSLSGSIRARDCTGEARGTFLFRRE